MAAAPVEDSYRLVSNILDERQADALELAALYHERWEIEGVFDEFKTHLRANSTVLRSKTPELVQQELWGLLPALVKLGAGTKNAASGSGVIA